jgi:starch-binding outer membrane protein, SusD/RagB family
MKLKFNIIAIILIVAFGCEDILTEKPKGIVAPDQFFNTNEEAEAAVFGVYQFLHLKFIGETDRFRSGSGYGTDVVSGRVEKTRDGDLDNFEPGWWIWQTLYEAVGAANMVISRMEASDKFDEEFRNRIIAEAKFLRAYYYLTLNLYWGNVPLWLEELDLEEVEFLPQSSSQEVRNQIIKDLLFAKNNLPGTVSENGRVTSWTAKSLLARVYLFNNQWEDAKIMAKDVIENSPHKLLNTVAEVFDKDNEFNKELIHVVPKARDIRGSLVHSSCSPRPFDDGPEIQKILDTNPGIKIIRPDGQLVTDVSSRNPGGIFQGFGTILALKEHYDSFEEGDSRKNLIWHEITFTNGEKYELTGGGAAGAALQGRAGYYWLKWISWDDPMNNGNRDIILQRLAEIYLILAEAENEINGPTGEAYEAINTVRRRAFGNNLHDLAGLSKDEFRRAIIKENAWELGGEGWRRFYLWHWGFETYKAAAESVKGSLPLLVQNLRPHHQWWKIPLQELTKNPNLKQNPGY